MSPAVVLLLLRLLSALLLLAFFGLIAWLIYRDIRLATGEFERQSKVLGLLRIVHDSADREEFGQVFPLYEVTRIGRAPGNSIVIDDAFASNEHALIARRDGKWWLEDLGSRNSTLLNDVPLDTPVVISSGDIITVGQTSLMLDLEVSE